MVVSGQRHAPAAVIPVDRRLSGSQSRSGPRGEDKEIPALPLSEIEPRPPSP